MLNNNISAIEEQFKKECTIIDLRKEYPEKVGEANYAVVTDIPNDIFINKYCELLELYVPYFVVGTYYLEVLGEYNAIEYKYEKRAQRKGMLFPLDDIACLCFPELQSSDCSDDYIIGETKRIVKVALEQLTTIQRERIYMKYWDKMSIREIAKKEGKDHKTISESLRSAEKKLRNFIKIPPQ